jgi:hypothetical protein
MRLPLSSNALRQDTGSDSQAATIRTVKIRHLWTGVDPRAPVHNS